MAANHAARIARLEDAEMKARAAAITAKIDADRADAEQVEREKSCAKHDGHLFADNGWFRHCISCDRRDVLALRGFSLKWRRLAIYEKSSE